MQDEGEKSKITILTVAQHHFLALQNGADDLLCVLSWVSSMSCGACRGGHSLRGRIGKYHQSWDWISRSANRHASAAPRCTRCRREGFFVGTIIFALTMLGLYLGSTLYHAWPQTRAKCVLQVFDHSAIFLLIAGTYTPFTLGPLRGVWGWTMLGSIWALAIFGVIMKVTRGAWRHPKLGLSLYLGMGWLALIVIRPLPSGHSATRIVLVNCGRNRRYDGSAIFR